MMTAFAIFFAVTTVFNGVMARRFFRRARAAAADLGRQQALDIGAISTRLDGRAVRVALDQHDRTHGRRSSW